MLSVMVSLFAVCWLPLHVFAVVVDFVPSLRSEDHDTADGSVVAIYTAVHWLAMSNSFANPIVYGFLNDGFRVRRVYIFRVHGSAGVF
jgi:leucokinin receptor